VLPRLLDVAAGVGLSAWFAASVLANALPRRAWIRRGRFSWLLPEWRFFAPNPATHDYELFCRFRSLRSAPTTPTIVRLPPRRAADAFVNPHSRARKATRDAVEEVLRTAHESPAADVGDAGASSVPRDMAESSEGYVALLREATRLVPGTEDPGYVQFGVLFVEGTDPPRLVFVSRWHPVG
jgi:hypothetical protein